MYISSIYLSCCCCYLLLSFAVQRTSWRKKRHENICQTGQHGILSFQPGGRKNGYMSCTAYQAGTNAGIDDLIRSAGWNGEHVHDWPELTTGMTEQAWEHEQNNGIFYSLSLSLSILEGERPGGQRPGRPVLVDQSMLTSAWHRTWRRPEAGGHGDDDRMATTFCSMAGLGEAKRAFMLSIVGCGIVSICFSKPAWRHGRPCQSSTGEYTTDLITIFNVHQHLAAAPYRTRPLDDKIFASIIYLHILSSIFSILYIKSMNDARLSFVSSVVQIYFECTWTWMYIYMYMVAARRHFSFVHLSPSPSPSIFSSSYKTYVSWQSDGVGGARARRASCCRRIGSAVDQVQAKPEGEARRSEGGGGGGGGRAWWCRSVIFIIQYILYMQQLMYWPVGYVPSKYV